MQTYPQGLPPKAQHDDSFKSSNQWEFLFNWKSKIEIRIRASVSFKNRLFTVIA